MTSPTHDGGDKYIRDCTVERTRHRDICDGNNTRCSEQWPISPSPSAETRMVMMRANHGEQIGPSLARSLLRPLLVCASLTSFCAARTANLLWLSECFESFCTFQFDRQGGGGREGGRERDFRIVRAMDGQNVAGFPCGPWFCTFSIKIASGSPNCHRTICLSISIVEGNWVGNDERG